MQAKTRIDVMLRYNLLMFVLMMFLVFPISARSNDAGNIKLEVNKFKIVFSDDEPEALKIALEALKKDFLNVMGSALSLFRKLTKTSRRQRLSL